MTGDTKPGDAVADKWRDRFDKGRRDEELRLMHLDVRAEKKSMGEDEISEVIHREALLRQQAKSDPPSGKAKAAASILKLLPEGWGRVVVVLAGIAAATFLAAKGLKLF